MRVSDSERQRVIDELRRHCGAGRIDVDEYALRIEKALGAATLQDLDQLLGDLPIIRIADPEGASRRLGRASTLTGGRAVRNGARASVARAMDGTSGPRGAGAPGGAYASGVGAVPSRLAATGVVALTMAVVVAVVALALTVSWSWALVLLVGWLVGVVQGRFLRWRR
jgi:hypothetical protein